MLHIHHGNRCEALFEALDSVLADSPPSPFQSETVVVQDQGMARWLAQSIARRRGVAANIDFPLPAAFIWRLLGGQLGEQQLAGGYDKNTLLWQAMALLPQLHAEPGFEPVAHYLGDGDRELKGYQLSRRVAELFDQYLIYRPDMIRAWESGDDPQWQARLWRAMREQSDAPHWAALLEAFSSSLAREGLRADLGQRISLFALSSLSPGYIELLALVAEHADIHLFILNPSINYWGDIVSERELARLRERWVRAGRSDVSELYQVGNPLLASMGRPARDFIELWQTYPAEEHEHFDESPGETQLLASIQADILHLQSRGEALEPLLIDEAAANLRVHACHGPMREVQVLHDSLLGLFESLPGLRPDQVIVAAPDIDAYAPYIEAVFGAAPADRHIPYSVSESNAASQPLIETLLEWLLLPEQRFEAPTVMAWLELPAVTARLGLDEGALERLRQWVAESGIRWGLDGKQRASLGLPDGEENSWGFGLRRLLLGYAMPADAQLYADTAPYGDIEGGEAAWLGLLGHFIERLQEWRRRLAEPATVAQWQRRINHLLDDLLLPSEHETLLLNGLREQLTRLVEHAERGGFQERLSYRLVHHHLSAQLTTGGGGQRLLNGRVGFCDMVAVRAIPFRVICLLGMNDGEFPRSQRPLGFDLVAAAPRRGDRMLREEDRYLFLEALLSAREHLHISYSGRSPRDNSEQLPSVLVSELLDYIDQGYRLASGAPRERLLIEHPLQPFSPRNFLHGSYAGEWLDRKAAAETFIARPLEAGESAETPTLAELLRFARNPARHFLQDALGVQCAEVDEALEESEGFALDSLQAYSLKGELLEAMLDGEGEGYPLARARGLLPHGEVGRQVYHEAAEGLSELAEAVQRYQREEQGGLLRYRPAKLKGQDQLRLWLEHLHHCAGGGEGESRHLAEDREFVIRPLPPAQAQASLRAWAELYRANLMTPQPLLPRASLEYASRLAKGKEEDGWKAAIKAWDGDERYPGEGSNPWFALAFRGSDPLDGRFEAIARELILPIFSWEA